MSASRLTLALVVMALPWGVPTSAAQDTGRFRGMDTNRDGVITRSEWRGNAQSFRQQDWNNDGVLSGDEVRASGQFEESDWTPRAFRSLDRNQDGRISRGEWLYDLDTFRRVDRDNDNAISHTEFVNGNNDEIATFESLDRNDNNRVEFAEWRGTRARFNELDRNRDGVLTRREVNRRDNDVATASFADEFTELDYNDNGVISVNEWPQSRASFNQHDLNRDGVVTRREFDAASSTTDDMPSRNQVQDVRVDPRERWTPTGVFVRAGDVINWQAAGTITMSGGNDTATPAGSTTGRRAANAPIREASAGGLLMRIGDSVVRYAGASGSFRASTSGELYLGVNDDHLPDNNGEYRVSVSIGR